jgi:rhomboid family protein
VEQLYGSRLFLGFYLLCAAAGSVASFVFGSDVPSVGASGAIFGLFGLLLAASRAHHPVLDRRGRSLVGQIGMLIVLNLILGFALGARIDNAAHVGGLLAGLWLGVLIVPGRVTTLRSPWRTPAGQEASGAPPFLLPALGIAALVVVLAVGIVIGTAQRGGSAVGQPGIAAARSDTASLSSSIRSPSVSLATSLTLSASLEVRSRAAS